MADQGRDRVGLAFALAFVVAGVLFLLDRLGAIELRIAYVVPVFLIALGVGILLGGRATKPSS